MYDLRLFYLKKASAKRKIISSVKICSIVMSGEIASGNSRKKDFQNRIEQLLNEVSACSKPLEAEIGNLTGMKGELSGIEKELERTKASLEKKQELSEAELEEIEDVMTILEDEFKAKRIKAEGALSGKEEAKKAEQYLTDLKYTKAEFENYKRRTDKDKRDFADYLLRGFIAELLPIKDNLEVAVTHAKENEHSEGLLKGMEMTVRQIEELFGREGLDEIKAEGEQFDPFRHEVVSKEVNDTHPENTVVEVIRKGYTFRGKVIRPAMVKIAMKGKKRKKRKK
jgi:molecular chaperone GrpE